MSSDPDRIAAAIIRQTPRLAPPRRGRHRYLFVIKGALATAYEWGYADGQAAGIELGRELERVAIIKQLAADTPTIMIATIKPTDTKTKTEEQAA